MKRAIESFMKGMIILPMEGSDMFRFAEEYNRDFNNLLLNNYNDNVSDGISDALSTVIDGLNSTTSECVELLYEYTTDAFDYAKKIADYAEYLEERIDEQDRLIKKLIKNNKSLQKQIDNNRKEIKKVSHKVNYICVPLDKK